MKATLGDLKASGMPERLGFSQCSTDFLNLISRAQSQLAYAGLWWGTYARINVCVSGGSCETGTCQANGSMPWNFHRSITWPRYVMSVLELASCDQRFQMANEWYEFSGFVNPPCGPYGYNSISMDGGEVPVFGPPPVVAQKVRIYPTHQSDVGKRVLITGTYDGNNQVRTVESGKHINGEYLTLAYPYVQSNNCFFPVEGVQKPLTEKRISLRYWDGAVETVAGDYDPSETRPLYRRTFIRPGLCGGCETSQVFTAIVRLRPVNPVADSDWLHIQSLDGIEGMARSIQYEDKHMPKEAERARMSAIRLMREFTDAMTGNAERTLISVDFDGGSNNRTFLGFN